MTDLGDKVKDIITGFTGIAVAKCTYLNKCESFEVQPALDKDGKWVGSKWIDAPQLEILSNKEIFQISDEKEKAQKSDFSGYRHHGGPGGIPSKTNPPSQYTDGDHGN